VVGWVWESRGRDRVGRDIRRKGGREQHTCGTNTLGSSVWRILAAVNSYAAAIELS
jgi:hypothetical protein